MPVDPNLLDLAGPPLLAFWEGLGPVILLIFWIVRQVITAIGEQKEAEEAKQQAEAARAQRADLAPGQLAPGEAEGADPGQADLRSEVDEFLKRVNERRQGGAPEPAQAEAVVLPAEPPAPPRRRKPIDPFEEPIRRKPKPRPEAETEPTTLRPEPQQPPRQTVSRPRPAKPARDERPKLRRLPESQLAEKAAHLGEEVARADDRTESRIQDKFEHSLGKLRSTAPPPEEKPDESTSETGAARIKALLARPGGVREAVILSEILRRPADSL